MLWMIVYTLQHFPNRPTSCKTMDYHTTTLCYLKHPHSYPQMWGLFINLRWRSRLDETHAESGLYNANGALRARLRISAFGVRPEPSLSKA